MLRHHALPFKMSQTNKIIMEHPQLCQLFLDRAWELLLLASWSALDRLWVPPASQCLPAALPSTGGLSSLEVFPTFLFSSPPHLIS